MLNTRSLFSEDEGASPVIGVVLIVAITILIATILGTFAFGLQERLRTSAQAGVDIDEQKVGPDEFEVTVKYTNKGSTQRIRAEASEGPGFNDNTNDGVDNPGVMYEVGQTTTATGLSSDASVTIYAITDKGEEQVLSTNYLSENQ